MDIFLDLTDRFPMTFDAHEMRKEVRDVQSDSLWLEHYDKALSTGWKAIPLVSQHGKIDGPESQRWGDVREFRRTPIVDKMPYFRSILDAFQCPQGRVRVLKLMPGAVIGMHRDVADEAAGYAYNKVRLHIPIQTNDKVVFHLGGSQIKMSPGRLYYCDFTQPHFVRNDGSDPRIHLVLDLLVNDFLRGVFPPETLSDKVVHWTKRRVMPVVWGAISARTDASRQFWKAYNGSAAQVLAHRVRGKRTATEDRAKANEKVAVG
jgi:hypothetical protein